MEGVTGQYLADVNISAPRSDADDAMLSQRLWEVSEDIVARF
jgi:hypothetical protein